VTLSESAIGVATRNSATAVLKAHVAVLKSTPMRKAISEALASGGNLGGKERRFVAFVTRELSRHMRRLDLSAKTRGYSPAQFQLTEDQAILRYAIYRLEFHDASPDKILKEVALPGPIRPRSIPDSILKTELARRVELDFGKSPIDIAAAKHSFPNWFAQAVFALAPESQGEAVLEALNREATLTVRVRPASSRDEMKELLALQNIETTSVLDDALQLVDEGRAIFESRFMKEGRLQVMDLGSQRLAQLCSAQLGNTVVDYCAGAGGKTIYLSDAVGPNGRVMAYDNSVSRLKEAKTKIHELKLRNVSFPEEPRFDLADIVFVDAPCSGSGTLAREPDQKWKLNLDKVKEFSETQRDILKSLAPKIKVGSKLVYGTCSIFKQENEDVVAWFLDGFKGFQLEEQLRVWPHESLSGGFFGARFVRKA
jgi:16S rRNA (cytosine967-C5)-methyltransferase